MRCGPRCQRAAQTFAAVIPALRRGYLAASRTKHRFTLSDSHGAAVSDKCTTTSVGEIPAAERGYDGTCCVRSPLS